MYRGSWLLVLLPLLIAALSVARPDPLPAPPLPPTFDEQAAAALARDLARLHPNRAPATEGALGAARWVRSQLAAYGYGRSRGRSLRVDRFSTEVAGLGRVELVNVSAVVDGPADDAIVVLAHRDDSGLGPGANDNGSGTGALLELARGYAGGGSAQVRPEHDLVFVSTDGGAFGGVGAERVAARALRDRILAVVNLDSVAGAGRPRLEIAGDGPRSPSGTLVATAAARIEEQTGTEPGRPGAIGQLVDLALPFSLYEQAPFVGRKIPAITLTTSGSRPPEPRTDDAERLRETRLGELGRAAQLLVGSLDQVEFDGRTSSYLYLGARHVRGWAIEIALIAALLPFLIASVDLFARCRRRGIALGPAVRSYRSRLGFWLFAGALFQLFAVAGIWPDGAARPVNPQSAAAGDWPVLGLLGLAALALPAWLVTRARLLPRRPLSETEALAGHAAALLALALVSLLVVATNAFALVFLLPSLHAWLWLPQLRDRPAAARAAVLLLGLAGPAMVVLSFAIRFGLGLDAPWYVAELVALGYIPLPAFVFFLAWAAAAAQLTTLAAGRYAPYPSAAERPPGGPIRGLVRAVILRILRRRARRRGAVPARHPAGARP